MEKIRNCRSVRVMGVQLASIYKSEMNSKSPNSPAKYVFNNVKGGEL